MNFIINIRKFISFVLLAVVLLPACNKDDNRNLTMLPPEKVHDLVAEPANQAVVLSWKNPEEKYIKHFQVTYGNRLLTVAATKNTVRIDKLENGKEYTFAVVVVRTNVDKSLPVEVKATPNKYVTTVEGKEFLPGTYLLREFYPTEIVITGSNYKRTWCTPGILKYIWEGALNKQNDNTYRMALEYYVLDLYGKAYQGRVVQDHNAVLCFSRPNSDSTYYAQTVYEKIEGDSKFLPGKYRSYIKSTSTNLKDGNFTTYYYLDITADGKISQYDSSNPSSVTPRVWSNNDLLKNNFFFVSFHSKTYLIEKNTPVYTKIK